MSGRNDENNFEQDDQENYMDNSSMLVGNMNEKRSMQQTLRPLKEELALLKKQQVSKVRT